MRHRLVISILTIGIFLGLPEVANACPVCFDINGEVRVAFIVTTAFLTLLPLAIVGGTGLWVRKKYRQMKDSAEATPEIPLDE